MTQIRKETGWFTGETQEWERFCTVLILSPPLGGKVLEGRARTSFISAP